jgi:hypothetical protein
VGHDLGTGDVHVEGVGETAAQRDPACQISWIKDDA